MGFDNECILNIQSLAGEYFCPVCRLLVYPNEALQSQCTHLYCKPCLTYIVNTTQACPYDGYLVTEADSKPLVESNKVLAETIAKIIVHCLFHRSGCTWQGPLSDCTSHCSGCSFGNSPVVCNRCAIQIAHRQVQEHAQSCPGVQPQASQTEGARNAAAAGAAVTANQNQVATLAGETTSQVQSQTTAIPPPVKDPNHQPSSTSQPQVQFQTAVPTAEQWYQQQLQYQQYYQQYPGYNPYLQHYQQYYPYQQQAVPQYQQPHLQIQPQVLPQAQSQPQMQQQAQSQPSMQPQAQVQPPAQSEWQRLPSHPPVQAVAAQPLSQALVNQQQQQTHPQHHGQPLPQAQSYPQAQPPQPHSIQPHFQHIQMPQYQQSQSQIQHTQPQIQNPVPQPQPLSQSLPNPQNLQTQVQHHPQPRSHPQLHPSLLNRPQVQHTAANAVMGHQPQPYQQIPLSGPPQHPMHVHPHNVAQLQLKNQVPLQAPSMGPPLSQATISNQPQSSLLPSAGQVANIPHTQQLPVRPHAPLPAVPLSQLPVMHRVQQPMPHQHVQQQQPFAGQQQQGPFVQQQLPVQSQLRPEGPHNLFQQHPHSYSQPRQNFSLKQGMQSHQPHSLGQPLTPNHGAQAQSFQQSATSVQGTLAQLGANQSSSTQSTNQVQLSSEQQAGAKPEMYVKQEIPVKIPPEREAESASKETAKTDNSGAPYVAQADVVGKKVPKSETDIKLVVDDIKAEMEDKTNVVDTSSKEFVADFESHTSENTELVNKKIVKEEVIENVEDQRDSANADIKQEEHFVSKEAHDGPLRKTPPMQLGGKFREQTGKVLKEQKLPVVQGAQGPGALPPAGQLQAGGFVQSPLSLYRSSTLQQRPAAPSMFQAPLPGAAHQTQAPTEIRPPIFKPHGAEIPPGGIPVSGPLASFGRGAGPRGLYQHGVEPRSIAPEGSYNLGHPHPSNVGTGRILHGNPVGEPPLRSGPPGAFDSKGGIMPGGPAYGPESQMGLKQPSNVMEADILTSQGPGYRDDRRSESHFPLEPPSGIQSNMMRMNGAPGLEVRDERFKSFPDEHLNPFPMDQALRVIDRGESKEDLKQFPRPSPLDAEPVPKLGSHFLSSRSFDRGPRSFGMDAGPRSFERGLNYESGLKLDPVGGFVPSRFSPSYNDGVAGRLNSSHAYPDFSGQGSAYGRRHMGGLSPRSLFGGHPGSLGGSQSERDNIDGREFHRFSDPTGSSIHETRFPVPPRHLRRDEFEGLGRNGDSIGQHFLPGHLQRGEPLGPYNLRSGETGGLGGFPGHARMGDLGGPGNFPQPRLGEPGFRSRFSRQGFPSDGGFYTGDLESFDNSRKRKPPTSGWCRICKVDCETVDGLDLHSQTREHQRMALDMVVSIKENAKKQKLTSSDRDDLKKSRNVNFDSRGKKH